MIYAYPLIAFMMTFLVTTRSLGWGIATAIAVGHLHGPVKANYSSIYTLFMYDSGMAGLYLSFLLNAQRYTRRRYPAGLAGWCQALIAWPTHMALIPVNDPYTQAQAWRMTVWYLPIALIACQCSRSDILNLGRSLAILNLISLSVGIYLYQYGVAALYPLNEATILIYQSADIAGGNYRIPANFIASGIYGSVMYTSLPLLIGLIFRFSVASFDWWLMMLGIVAAAGGVILCGTRSPIVATVLLLTLAWAVSGFSAKLVSFGAVLIAGGIWMILSNERFQRIFTLDSTEAVTGRMYGSLNESFIELILKYPTGAGMGTPVGGENEYARIVADQGIVGLALWLGFIIWLVIRTPSRQQRKNILLVMVYCNILATFGTAFIGVGAFASIPGSSMFLLQIGLLTIDTEPQLQRKP
jgi:hypothetical protein